VQQRLQVIILAHVWALVPVAVAWFARPAWRGEYAPKDVSALLPFAIISAAYLILRTWLTVIRWTPQLVVLYPYMDVGLVTAGLIVLRNPSDPLSILYFIPLASAVASLSMGQITAVGAATVIAYLAAIIVSSVPWTIGMLYRLIMLALMSSLYWLIIKIVSTYARAAEPLQRSRMVRLGHSQALRAVRQRQGHRHLHGRPIGRDGGNHSARFNRCRSN